MSSNNPQETTEETKPKWREQDGVIYFSVTPDYTTLEDLRECLEDDYYATKVFWSLDFNLTSGMTIEVAVLKGTLFEKDGSRTTKKICAFAKAFKTPDKRRLVMSNAKLAYLIHKKFTDKEIEEMGLRYIVPMRKPINASGSDPRLLGVCRDSGGRRFFPFACNMHSDWPHDGGFAFMMVGGQVGPQP